MSDADATSRRLGITITVTALSILAGALNAATPDGNPSTFRPSVSLNADASTRVWTFRPVKAFDRDNDFRGPRKPVTIPAGPITVPSYWSDSNPDWDDDWQPRSSPRNKWIEQAEYSRRFDVPADMAGRRIKLHFGAVNHAAQVRVNGKPAGPKHYQGTVPFEYDVTDLVTPGSKGNELKVMVWDHTHLRDGKDPSKYAWPFGHAMWAHKMSGIGQDVALRAVPAVHVADVHVVTSVEKMTVTLAVTIINEADRPHTVIVENDFRRITRLKPTERSVRERTLNADASVTVEPGGRKTVTLRAKWPKAALWWPHRPQLYRLHTRLKERGRTVDEKTDVRFGFREFRIDPATGNRYNLNGLPFRGRGDTFNAINRNIQHSRPALEYLIDTFKAFGAVLIRHGAAIPPPPLFWNVCDEKGMLCIEEMFFNGQNENHKGRPWRNGIMFYTNHYGDPAFERHVDEMARAIVRRDRNHPSIAIWSIENEVFYNPLPQQPTEKQKDDVGRLRKVIEALDATRPVGCDHEGTLDGRLGIKNKHYPGKPADLNDDFRAKRYTNWDPISAGTNVYWVLKADPPKVPFGVGEFMFHRKRNLKDPTSIDSPYNWGRLRAYQVRAYRLFGMSDIRVFTYGHDALTTARGLSTRSSHMVNRRSLSAVAVFDHDYDGRDPRKPPIDVDEGSTHRRRYDVYNDDVADTSTEIAVNWQVRLYDRVTDSGSKTVAVPLATSRPVELAWRAPRVNADTNFIVAVEAVKSGRQVFTDFRVFTARDRGGPAVAVSETFRDDFAGGPTKGWIEYDTFWRMDGGAYVQPETRGLFPFGRPQRDAETGKWSPARNLFGHNAHMSAIGPWKFDDLRASFDVTVLRMDPGYDGQWAGMGLRLTHPEDSPYEDDRTRISGYYVGLRRVGPGDRSEWQLFLAKADPTRRRPATLAAKAIRAPAGRFVKVTIEMGGANLTARAGPVRISAVDRTYRTGYASLVMGPRAAAAYDNVVISRASGK